MKRLFVYLILGTAALSSCSSHEKVVEKTPSDMRRELFLAREKALSSCLRRDGYSYVSRTFESSLGPVQKLILQTPQRELRKLRSQIGYGISTGEILKRLLKANGISAVQSDLNRAYVDSLEPNEVESYKSAFASCLKESERETRGLQIEADSVARRELSRLDSLNEKWSKCMREVGLPGFRSQSEVMMNLSREFSSAADDEGFTIRETGVAVADFDCASKVRVAN
jgi:hypothetical protein